MSVKLESASRVTPRTMNPGSVVRLEVMKTERSSKLARMMTHFRDPKRKSYSYDDLSHLGITVISLPGADILLTNEGPFRPHSSFAPDLLQEFSQSKSVESWSAYMSTTFRNQLQRMGFAGCGCSFPWREIYTLNPFFGVVEGLLSPVGPKSLCVSSVKEWVNGGGFIKWLEPEVLRSLKNTPPHVQIILSHSDHTDPGEKHPLCDTQSDGILPGDALTAIVTAIHNRVYQVGFEDETLFPVSEEQLRLSNLKDHLSKYLFAQVLLFSDHPPDRMRMIEAVFDINCEKLTLRITPMYHFGDPETAPWDIFVRMHASTPRVSSSSAHSLN